MGLLDSLGYGNQGGYSGLLDMLMYPSPMNQKPEYSPYGGIETAFDTSAPRPQNPFGPVPQSSPVPASNATFGSVPNLGLPAPTMPIPDFASVGYRPPQVPPPNQQPMTDTERQLMRMAGVNAPATAPTTAPVAPQAPQIATPQARASQVNDMQIGGYSMPRFGTVADYTPQVTDVSAQSRAPQAQQQATQQAPQALPPAFGGSGSALGRAFNPDGLIARLTGNDSRSIAQQNLKAQYEALVPIVGQQKAMLAVLNPEAGKTILAQALEKKNFGFTKLDNDTVLRTDPLTGKAEVAYGGGGSVPMQGPDGKLIEMPQGADPKTWRNEITRINADVAAGKKTEVQAKAEIFGNKMELANKSISDNVGTSLAGKIASGLPLGNYAQSADYQKYKAASSNFITALLRQESGAAISKTEFDRYEREYMPQPGDGPEVLANKAEARRVAIEGMKKGAGPGYKSPTNSGAVRKYNPATGRIE